MSDIDREAGWNEHHELNRPQSFDGLLSDEDRRILDEMVDHAPAPPETPESPESPMSPESLIPPTPMSEPETPEVPETPEFPEVPGVAEIPGVAEAMETFPAAPNWQFGGQPADQEDSTPSQPPMSCGVDDDSNETENDPESHAILDPCETAPQPESDLLERIDDTEECAETLGHDIEALLSERDQMASRLDELEALVQDARQLAEQAELENHDLAAQFERKFDEQSGDLETLGSERDRINRRIEEYDRECQSLQAQIEQELTQRQTLDTRLAEANELTVERDRNIEFLRQEIVSNNFEIESITQERTKGQEHLEALQNQIETKQTQHREAVEAQTERIRTLEESQENLRLEHETAIRHGADRAEKLQLQLDQKVQANEQQEKELEQFRPLRQYLTELEQQRDENARRAEVAERKYEQRIDEFEQTRVQLQSIAVHLACRKGRLVKLDDLLHQRTDTIISERLQDGYETIKEEQRKLRNERQHLLQHQETLKATEQKMIHKWAPQKASLVVSALVFLFLATSIGSWLLTDSIFPPRRAATVTLSPKTSDFKPLTEEQERNWQQYHIELVLNTQFQETLVKRMRDRQLPVEDMDIESILGTDLSFDTGQSGDLSLTLSGTNHALVRDVLDVLVSTVLVESTRSADKRSDGAWAVASNQRQEGGINRYAVLNKTPVKDQRLVFFAPVFLVFSIFLGGLLWVLYGQFSKAQRIISEKVVIPD